MKSLAIFLTCFPLGYVVGQGIRTNNPALIIFPLISFVGFILLILSKKDE
jgi:hypothetical protein